MHQVQFQREMPSLEGVFTGIVEMELLQRERATADLQGRLSTLGGRLEGVAVVDQLITHGLIVDLHRVLVRPDGVILVQVHGRLVAPDRTLGIVGAQLAPVSRAFVAAIGPVRRLFSRFRIG